MGGESRRQLVERLQSERDPEILGRHLADPAWQVRWAAIDSLRETGSPSAEPYLIEVIASARDPRDLPLANAALGRVGSKRAIPALTALIHHPTDDVKGSAIHALGVLGDSSLTPVYLDALRDRSWIAKWSATGAIAARADERAIEPVILRLRSILGRDRKTKVGGRTEVMEALTFLGRWQAVNASAAGTIDWVRSHALGRLQADERTWFDSTFG